MSSRYSSRGASPAVLQHRLPQRFALFLFATIAILVTLGATSRALADEGMRGLDPRSTIDAARNRSATPDSRQPAKSATHPSTFLPIPDLPIEDVDAVEFSNASNPDAFAWPTTSFVHFYSGFGVFPTATVDIPTFTAGVTGCDFTLNGAMTAGVYQTLGAFYMFDLTTVPPTLTASGFLPGGVPQRRDIDPLIFADPVSPSGESAIYITGTGLHCRAIPTGAVRWDIYLPSVMVEAVDPAMSPSGNLWAPFLTGVAKIDPIGGFILGVAANPAGSAPVREIDIRFSGGLAGPGPAAAWMPTNGFLSVYSDAPGGAPVSLAGPFGVPSAYIEGNDLELNPAVTLGYIPTLSAMVQVDLPGLAISATYPLFGFAHQRNQDAVFTATGVAPAKWVYAMQGAILIGDNVLAAPAPAVLASPGVTYDGVDPAFSDTPPFGSIVSIATSAGTNVYHAPSTTYFGTAPRSPGAGPLRTDVDHKPAPQFGNYIVQPTTGGLLAVGGFGPNDWLVTVANGIEVVDLGTVTTVEFMSYGALGAFGAMTYRGGDAQPTMYSPGPVEPGFSVDNPDQDFVTKCWEYKYAMNRWPYWYSFTMPNYYPHYLPYGVFGPPALVGWDMLNHDKVVLLASNEIAILNHQGSLLYQFPLPAPAIGGLIWDWDNKICKVRCYGQLEFIINLTPLGYGSPPLLSTAFYGSYTRWYPIVDRMNGWEFAIYRGGRNLWVYDHYNNFSVANLVLPARVIRRPVFDEQRKTLCIPLANRTIAYFNADAYRKGLPPHRYLYYSPVLPSHIVHSPVFDFYNHHTVLQLKSNQLCVLDNSDATIRWMSPVLPYIATSPLQIDCYNKIGKQFYRDPGFNYYEMWLDLYPLVFGGIPNLQWISLVAQPYGYPVFDAMDGFELCRLGTNRIEARSLFNTATVYSAITPFPIVGNLFIDRVNKYALCALQGPRVYYIDLYRFTQGDATAAKVINLPFPPTARATEDIVFMTQLRQALVHVDINPTQTGLAAINLRPGTATTYSSLSSLPRINRQMYVHPFRGLVNYPWYLSPNGGEVTIDMTPTTWSPPQQPQVQVLTLSSPPTDAFDTVAPPAPVGASIVELPAQPDDVAGVIHYEVSGLEPGSMLFADVTSSTGQAPTEATVDDDGRTDDISVIAAAGETVCFTALDAAGNVSPAVCTTVIGPADVPGTNLPARLSFAMRGENPVLGSAVFDFALPHRAEVELGIYDVTGRLVTKLVDREIEAGDHTETWDLAATRVEAGVYFVRIAAGGEKKALRVIVLK